MFGLWAILKSPLVIGTDLRKLSKAALNILTAEEIIAVNQDKLGVAGDLVYKEGPEEVSFLVASPSGQTLQGKLKVCCVSHVTMSGADYLGCSSPRRGIPLAPGREALNTLSGRPVIDC